MKIKMNLLKKTPKDKDKLCVCGKDYETPFMICCDICEVWFHGPCVKVSKRLSSSIEKYHCNKCAVSNGPSLTKKEKRRIKNLEKEKKQKQKQQSESSTQPENGTEKQSDNGTEKQSEKDLENGTEKQPEKEKKN